MFRTSNARVTRAFAHATHPHGTVISADAFKRRLIRSGTDFEVYDNAGMKGLDLAFYRQRSWYHTKHDSVSSLGGQSALSAMMEAALGAGQALVNDQNIGGAGKTSDSVYFDRKHARYSVQQHLTGARF